MKKIFALLLAGAMLASFTACGNVTVEEKENEAEETTVAEATTAADETAVEDTAAPEAETTVAETDAAEETAAPEAETTAAEAEPDVPVEQISVGQTVNDAITKTDALTYVSADISIDMVMNMMGMEIPASITATIAGDYSDTENPIVKTTMKYDALGVVSEEISYTADGWEYIVSDGDSYKLESDPDNDGANLVDPLPLSVFEGAEFTQNDDGSLTVTVVVPAEEFNNVSLGLAESISDGMGDITDMTATFTVKDGYLTGYELAMTMSTVSEGVTMDTEMTITITFTILGEKITITPPEGYQDFEEYDFNIDDFLYEDEYTEEVAE